jgi:DNA repair exonuclease SbcCD ATPase subunit
MLKSSAVYKEQIREEEKARREIEKSLRDAEKEEETLQKAMDKVKAQMEQANEERRAKYEAQIAELEQKWKNAEERNQRALSMAQQTKSGHVYIISNIGSFGENVCKIGMTRRLDPLDRVRELGDASVPFAFDVHAMIWSNDAPALETTLHKKFALGQLNKVNYRKEFFRVSLQDIQEELEKSELEIKWTMTAEAREYRESLAIEEALKDNPEAQKTWLERQFTLEAKTPLGMLRSDDDLERDVV